MFAIRKIGYRMIDALSEVEQVRNNTGFGLFDQAFVSVLRRLPDPYPYFRGIVSELGYRYATIPYNQPKRVRGVTKNNLYRFTISTSRASSTTPGSPCGWRRSSGSSPRWRVSSPRSSTS